MRGRRASRRTLFCLILVAGLATGAAGETRGAAVDDLQSLRQALAQDKTSQKWQSYLAHAQKLETLLNASPIAHLEIARAEMKLGNVAAAQEDVAAFLAMGQTHPFLQSPLFEPLHAAIEGGFAANGRAVSAASLAFALSDAGLLAEDIDYDARSGRFFLSSVVEHKIVTRDAKGRETTFARSPDKWPVLALKIDSARRRLWATEVAFDGFDGVPATQQGRSALLEYDLDTSKLVAHVLPQFHCALGDMVLAPDGTPLVSDGKGGGIYRLRRSALQRIDHGEFISPQTIAVDPATQRLFVPDYLRGIAIMRLSGEGVRWMSMQDRYALDGIDGLYFEHGNLLAVQNGTKPERVAAFALDRGGTQVVRQRIVEQATASFGDPTHGVVVGDEFYYIANSGWDKLDEHGRVKPGFALTPARIMRVKLGGIPRLPAQ